MLMQAGQYADSYDNYKALLSQSHYLPTDGMDKWLKNIIILQLQWAGSCLPKIENLGIYDSICFMKFCHGKYITKAWQSMNCELGK